MSTADEKQQAFLEMLDQGMTMVHLNARVEGTDVPDHLRDDPHLRLNFSYKFGLEVFDINPNEIVANLSFQGTPYNCVIPWSAVFALWNHVTNDTRIWESDMPMELIEAHTQAMSAAQEQVGALKAVESTAEADESEFEAEEPGGAVRRVGHLRVIK